MKTNDDCVVEGIIQHDEKVIRWVYREYYREIKKMVFSFRNSSLDPEEVFQEGFTRAMVNIRNGNFRRESSFLTYLNSICRNICLKELSRISFASVENDIFYIESNPINFERINILLGIRNRLEEKCRRIIDLRFGLREEGDEKGLSFGEISGILGISPENARQRFKRCLDKLREYVKESKEFKEGLFL